MFRKWRPSSSNFPLCPSPTGPSYLHSYHPPPGPANSLNLLSIKPVGRPFWLDAFHCPLFPSGTTPWCPLGKAYQQAQILLPLGPGAILLFLLANLFSPHSHSPTLHRLVVNDNNRDHSKVRHQTDKLRPSLQPSIWAQGKKESGPPALGRQRPTYPLISFTAPPSPRY